MGYEKAAPGADAGLGLRPEACCRTGKSRTLYPGLPWSADGLLNQIKAKARRLEGIRPITPKMLRDSFGTIMANDIGLPLPELQILMGHTDIKTTMQYVRARGARTWLTQFDSALSTTE